MTLNKIKFKDYFIFILEYTENIYGIYTSNGTYVCQTKCFSKALKIIKALSNFYKEGDI